MDCGRVLLADDDAEILELIKLLLQSAGFSVKIADNGARALGLWRTNLFDVIILDVMMPILGGLETCRLIRQVSRVPVILLTAKGEEKDILDGFEAGASDYIVKPFRPRELVARIQAVLERGGQQPLLKEKRLAYEDLVLDLQARELYHQGQVILLAPIECSLLKYFIEHAGEIITKQDLLRNVWGCANISGDLNLVEAAIRRLRARIGDDPREPRLIFTVWGAGYRLGSSSFMPKTVNNLSELSVV